METAVQTVDTSPQTFITQAIEKGLSIEHLDKLLTLQQRWNADKAREAFFVAFNMFQSMVPVIEKKKKVAFNTTNYKYADLAEISETIKETAKECGFSYRWKFSEEGTKITCTCIVSHIQGHSEESSMTAEKDTSGNKNSIQAIGSARTYLQRYTLIAGLGLTTADEDNDAQTVVRSKQEETEPIHEQQQQMYSSKPPEQQKQNTVPSTKNETVSFKEFNPNTEKMTFGKKYSGMEWMLVDKSYLQWMSESASGINQQKAKLTLEYMEKAEKQEPVVDDLDAVFWKKAEKKVEAKQPETLTAPAIDVVLASLDDNIRLGTLTDLEKWWKDNYSTVESLSAQDKKIVTKAYSTAKKSLEKK